jgi:hypothetical protein
MARKAQSSVGSFTGTLNNAARLYAKPHSTNLLEQAEGLDRSIAKVTRRMMLAAKAGNTPQVIILSDLLARQKAKRHDIGKAYAEQKVAPIYRDREHWEETNGQAKVHTTLKAPAKSTSKTKAKARQALAEATARIKGDKS